ncbi:hypothetical protein V6N13_143738 [Hibiscus sabdariffa]|uniref:Uncharacterized protein n=1 Tax=Hibiscus sabdariffa TaxID=183260 RepID=A0ABR2FIF6_9ROSI
MGLPLAVKALLLLQLSLLLPSSYFAVSAPVWPQASPPHKHAVSPVIPPSPPSSHHHHHPRPHPPTPSPIIPPTPPPKVPTPAPPKPPIHPPTKPPTTKPPTYPTPKPPTTKAPTNPPTKPPTTKPPTYPTPKPPTTKAPTNPPTKPPTTKQPTYPTPRPPTKAPTKPPTQPPTKAPTKPPTQPPTKAPTKPPTYPPSPPAKPPTYPTSSQVAVQGVVYCKSCKYAGVDTLLGSKPVLGASVKLACKDSKNDLTVQFVTDKNGYFFLQAPITIINFSLSNCSVSLVSSPLKSCSTPSNMNGGLKGAPLKPENSSTSKKLPYVLYSVGPFAFEPKCH